MTTKNYSFPIIFWGGNKSTKVQFKISNSMPNDVELITSVMCAVQRRKELLLVRPKRGWGLPGGHVEEGEPPIDAIIRECREEASVDIKNIRLVGYWEADKIKDLDENKQYPKKGYQLLFIAELDKLHKFEGNFEVDFRRFVKPDMISSLHHNFKDFQEILKYLIDLSEGKNA